MSRDDTDDLRKLSKQGGQESVNPKEEDKPGNMFTAGRRREMQKTDGDGAERFTGNRTGQQIPPGGMPGGRVDQGGQVERSGAGQTSDEDERQKQLSPRRGDGADQSWQRDQSYDQSELRPGGTGKQGDQQQIQRRDRETRKDKSKSSGGSDKMH